MSEETSEPFGAFVIVAPRGSTRCMDYDPVRLSPKQANWLHGLDVDARETVGAR
jgi:hypothetical protein